MIKRLCLVLSFIAGLVSFAWLNPPKPDEPQISRWQKINAQGEPIANWKGPWSCVLDKESGLLWEIKSDSENLHDASWSYSWFDGEHGESDMGDCLYDTNGCDTLDHLRKTNAESLCGHKNWRLPSAEELTSLLDFSVPSGHTKINSAFFPRVHKGDYWTNDHSIRLTGFYSKLGEGSKAVDFKDGSVKTLPYRNAAFLMLVSDYTRE